MTVNFLPIYHVTILGGCILPMIAIFLPLIVFVLSKYAQNKYVFILALLIAFILFGCTHTLVYNSTHPLLQKVVGQKAKCVVSDALPIRTIKSVAKFYNVDKYEYDFENNVLTLWKYNEKE